MTTTSPAPATALRRLQDGFQKQVDAGNDPTVIHVHMRRPVLHEHCVDWGKLFAPHGTDGFIAIVGSWSNTVLQPHSITHEGWFYIYGVAESLRRLESLSLDSANLLWHAPDHLHRELWSGIPFDGLSRCLLAGYWLDAVLEIAIARKPDIPIASFAAPLDRFLRFDLETAPLLANLRHPWLHEPQPVGWTCRIDRFATASVHLIDWLIDHWKPPIHGGQSQVAPGDKDPPEEMTASEKKSRRIKRVRELCKEHNLDGQWASLRDLGVSSK